MLHKGVGQGYGAWWMERRPKSTASPMLHKGVGQVMELRGWRGGNLPRCFIKVLVRVMELSGWRGD